MIQYKTIIPEPTMDYLQMFQFEVDGIDHLRRCLPHIGLSAAEMQEALSWVNPKCGEAHQSKDILWDIIRQCHIPAEYHTDEYTMVADFTNCEVIISDKT
jgi:hypothetical protein